MRFFVDLDKSATIIIKNLFIAKFFMKIFTTTSLIIMIAQFKFEKYNNNSYIIILFSDN